MAPPMSRLPGKPLRPKALPMWRISVAWFFCAARVMRDPTFPVPLVVPAEAPDPVAPDVDAVGPPAAVVLPALPVAVLPARVPSVPPAAAVAPPSPAAAVVAPAAPAP